MDFSQFEVETDKPVFVQFRHPISGDLLFEKMQDPEAQEPRLIDDTSKPVGANLFGQDSVPFIERRRFLLDQQVAHAKRSGVVSKVSAVDLDKQNRGTVIACIHSFVNVEWDGKPLDNRREVFDAFLTKHNWAYTFINAAIVDRENFLKASQTN